MKQHQLTCREVNQIDMVDYLSKQGYAPQKIRGNDYWYQSPFREEKTASFKVNRKLNVWFDHGSGNGGTLVDFGILYYKCSVKELLQKMMAEKDMILSFHPHHFSLAGEKKELPEQSAKIKILSVSIITDIGLLNYLKNREISLPIAHQFCQQICFELYTKKWAKITKTSQDTALRDIQDLVNKAILTKEPGGGRSTSYTISE